MSEWTHSHRWWAVYGPGFWTATLSLTVFVGVVFNGLTHEQWSTETLLAVFTKVGLGASLVAVVIAQGQRMRAGGDPQQLVESQSLSGVAIIAVGMAIGAAAGRIRVDVPSQDAWSGGVVLTLGLILLFVAATQIVTSTRALIADGRRAFDAAQVSEREAHETELIALQQRLEPDLVLRVMTAIGDQAERDPRQAERAVEALASYLRKSLQSTPVLNSTVAQEVASAHDYLDLMEQAGVHVPTLWKVDDGVRGVEIPTGALRTFLDYAVSRCLRQQEMATITVKAFQHAERLYLVVSDTAAPDPPTLAEPEALSNLRRRVGAPPKRRARVETARMVEVDGTASGTTQTLVMRMDGGQ